MIAGTRKAGDFDVGALLKRGGKDAAVGFVGTLVGGKLAEVAVRRLGLAAFAQMNPTQVSALDPDRAGLTVERSVLRCRPRNQEARRGAARTLLHRPATRHLH